MCEHVNDDPFAEQVRIGILGLSVIPSALVLGLSSLRLSVDWLRSEFDEDGVEDNESD